MQYVIFYGNPLDGFILRGPFDSAADAIAYAENVGDSDWWVGELNQPSPEFTQ